MRWFEKIRMRYRSLLRRSQVDGELDDELRFHLEQQIEENLATGMSPEQARSEALRSFGGGSQIAEACRDSRGVNLLNEFFRDLRFSIRTLRKSPLFSGVAILTLGLGIGANTCIFTLINAVMLRTLPVHEPHELVLFSDSPSTGAPTGDPPGNWFRFSYPSYQYLRDQNQAFDGLAAFQAGQFRLAVQTSGSDAVDMALGQMVSGNYFSVLGVRAAAGRALTVDDNQPGAAPVAVISYSYWERKFGRDPAILGQTVNLNQMPVTIAGVAPKEFFGERVSSTLADFWLPIILQPQVSLVGKSYVDADDTFWLNMVGRLRPGVTILQAQAELNTELRQFVARQYGSKFSGARQAELDKQHLQLFPGARGLSVLRGPYSTALQILMGLVGLVLLIACVNVANLLLARAAAREKETAMRLALGASRSRLIRQFLTESLVLSVLGGAFGLAAAALSVRTLAGVVASRATPLNLNPDSRILGFTFLACLVTALLSGIAPALRATRVDPLPSLSGATAAQHGSRFGLGNVLVVAQIAMSLLLVVSAGLFARSLSNLERQDLGFDRDHLLMIRFDSRVAGYQKDQLPALYHRLLDRVNSLPEVRSATIAYFSPLSGTVSMTSARVAGHDPQPGEDTSVWRLHVGPRYFETLGIPLIAGRGTLPEDENGPAVCVINESAARNLFPGENPIGKRLAHLGSATDLEIVGLVADAKFDSLRDPAPRMVFLPFVRKGARAEYIDEIEARVSSDPKSAARQIRSAIAEVEPHLPITGLATIDDNVRSQSLELRAISVFSSSLGALALILASVGVYGVMAHRVAGRTREIGVRMAIGAARRSVFGLVLRQALKLAICGVVTGLVLAAALAQPLASLLFGLKAMDPLVVGLSSLLLLLTSAVACLVPARRAMKVDPSVALKCE